MRLELRWSRSRDFNAGVRGTKRYAWCKAITLVTLLVTGGGVCRAGLTDYTIKLSSPRDQANLAWEGGNLAVGIVSAIGIGRLQLVAKKQAAWPNTIILSIRNREGKSLKELEGFTLSGKALVINGSRRTSGRMECREVDPKNPGIRRNARQVGIVVTRTEAAMEVRIPGSVLKGERDVVIEWIDFYR